MKRSPFQCGEYGGEWVDAESRLDRVKTFDVGECRAALKLATGLQKTVRLAIERRLRRLEWIAAEQKVVDKAVRKTRRQR